MRPLGAPVTGLGERRAETRPGNKFQRKWGGVSGEEGAASTEVALVGQSHASSPLKQA